MMVFFLSFCHTTGFGKELPEAELHEPMRLYMQYCATRLETGLPKA